MHWDLPSPRMCCTQSHTEAWPPRIWTDLPAGVLDGGRRMHTNSDMPRDLHYPWEVFNLTPMPFPTEIWPGHFVVPPTAVPPG